MLKELDNILKSSYNSSNDNVINEFYNRVLSHSVEYKRVSGYFSSKALSLYSIGLENLEKEDGKAKFLVSTEISEHDFNQIKQGYELRSKYDELDENDIKRLGNLAFLISKGNVDIKFGLVSSGLFHNKWGLFKDKDGEIVYINGSTNETGQGLNRNYDSFDVDFSWDVSMNVRERIQDRVKEFDALWENRVKNVNVLEATNMVYELIKKYDKGRLLRVDENQHNSIKLTTEDGYYQLVDNTIPDKGKRKQCDKRSFQKKFVYYEDKEKHFPYLRKDLLYTDLLNIIEKLEKLSKKNGFNLTIDEVVTNFIQKERYTIDEYRKAGLTIKKGDARWESEEKEFEKIVNSETERNLKSGSQIRSAFFMLTQKRAGNFSVPGSGKTAMTLGVFAYLNRQIIGRPIKRLLVICPLSAFHAWEEEFKVVFGDKKPLQKLSIHDEAIKRSDYNFIRNWGKSNLVLINYESLKNYEVILNDLLSESNSTMLVFDEGHRIKGIESKRAEVALNISRLVDYKFYLTGTPIPNSYLDIFNMLQILYRNEYKKFFGYEKKHLKNPSDNLIENINKDLSPYFWRTNKEDLNVPEPEEDIIIEVGPSDGQIRLAEYLYDNIDNPLAIWIRLIQVSTNPQLLNQKIDFLELGMSEVEIGEQPENQIPEDFVDEFEEAIADAEEYKNSNFNLGEINSPKFNKGIELVENLVNQNKKVVVWGLFVDTLLKIKEALLDKNINVELVYGATQKNDRDTILERFNDEKSELKVLISNPNTLGEAISLHKVAHDAVYFEYNYNLTFMLQSRDRIHRLGLEPSDYTRYYYLMTSSEKLYNNFIDKKIYDRLQEKYEIMKSAIDGELLVPTYTDDMIEFMKKTIKSERKFKEIF